MSATDVAPGLIPELLVSSLPRSLDFWCGVIGFGVLYQRPEDGFARIVLGRSQLMLEQQDTAPRTWVAAPLALPFGRGMNLQIEVPDFAALLLRVQQHDIPFFLRPEERWYRRGTREIGQRQCVLQDPDGYLVRPIQPLGERLAGGG